MPPHSAPQDLGMQELIRGSLGVKRSLEETLKTYRCRQFLHVGDELVQFSVLRLPGPALDGNRVHQLKKQKKHHLNLIQSCLMIQTAEKTNVEEF